MGSARPRRRTGAIAFDDTPSPADAGLARPRRLIADKEDTAQVFEIMNALAGQSVGKGYARLLETPEGGWQAFLMGELADRLQDWAWLESLPTGSVGAAYLAFIQERDISAYGLADESLKVTDTEINAAHPRA